MKKRTCGFGGYLGLVLLLGCSDSAPGSGGGRNGGNQGDGDASAADGGGTGWQGSGTGDGSVDPGPFVPVGDAALADAAEVDTPTCGGDSIEATIERTEIPGNVLVVYDISGSMNDDWELPDGSKTKKLPASQTAFLDAITPIASKISVGTIFFPNGGTCNVAALDSGSQIAMMPGDDYLLAWTAFWTSRVAEGSTPLLEGLMAADVTLTGSTFTGTTVVLVITDGDPKCNWNATTANALVAKWLGTGIKTYVIGLPGLTGTGNAILTDIAIAGGTTNFITPTDSMVLQTEIAKIVTETVTSTLNSCVIELDPPPPSADKVQMVATENGKKMSVPRVLSDDAGWSITDDGSEVTLEGLLCRDAKAGRFSKISFKYGCVDLPPIEAPIPE
jgi:hypothetical protein